MYVVYRFWNHEGVLLYVGCTGRGISRVEQHRRGKSWFEQTANITLTHFPTEKEAFQEEARAIKMEKPLHNSNHNAPTVQLDQAPPKRKITDRAMAHNRSSGARNVSFNKATQKWLVQINKNGKSYRGGLFRELDDAIAKAEQMRKDLYGPNLIVTSDDEGEQ